MFMNTCTGVNTGTRCYSNKYLDATTNTCQLRNIITDECVRYKTANSDVGDCLHCSDGFQLLHDTTVTPVKWTCRAGDAAHAGIEGCKYGYMYKVVNSFWLLCYACQATWYPSQYFDTVPALASSGLFNVCTLFNNRAHDITNCSYMGMTGPNTYKCYACKAGYVLKNDGTQCILYDGDSKCARAGSNDTGCAECWWPYWFHDSLCKKAGLIGGGGMVIAALTVFVIG